MVFKKENYSDTKLLYADGFDDAILGVDDLSERVIYSVSSCIQILEKDMSREEAIEFFDYNMAGAYMGEHTPIWCNDLD